MSDVPENLPMLRRGAGYAPHVGGCLVQVANWLCDHTLWTDFPEHVDRVLVRYGIPVNDRCDDADRRELALAVVRIAGTAGVLTPDQSAELRAWAEELFLLPDVLGQLCRCGCGVTHVPGPRWNDSLPSEELVERYFLLVEMFEELSGHQPRVVPEEEWAELAMAMSTPPPPVMIDEVHYFQNANHVTLKAGQVWTAPATGSYTLHYYDGPDGGSLVGELTVSSPEPYEGRCDLPPDHPPNRCAVRGVHHR